ncbi:hypothetical protein BDY19DRAFT_994869 [Irpex rosettiformis]|uniref:Uncharacterized protein n=1 Tax=Irpex rosettiformis TaxID=378272 RepID=A0ACB8TZN8_9APHY|nr:hypothetical protein BDY19DRAFT_994869 [Irpex rosettiformis]
MGSDLIHDQELWFTDGSIVLLAEKTLFRVYAGILSRASPIFRDMFAIGQVHNAEETYEGCPLVVMAGDNANDMRAFLEALHDPRSFQMNSPKPTDIPHIVSVLRVSTKYDAIHLRRRAIEALQTWYGDSLSAYQQGLEVLRSWSNTSPPVPSPIISRKDFFYNILVANVAIEASATVPLPAALLLCCVSAQDFRVPYDGVTNSDGILYELVPEAKRSIFIGRPVLENIALVRKSIRNFKSTQDCKSPGICGDFCRMVASKHETRGSLFLDPFFPFFRLNRKVISGQSCEACRSGWEASNKRETEILWRDLPLIFDLPPWDVLQSASNEDCHEVPTAGLPVPATAVLDLVM